MRLPGPYRDVGIEGNPRRATTTEGRAWHDRRQFAGEAVLQMAAAVNLQPNRTHRRIEPHARILQAELYVRQIEWRGGFGIAKLVEITEQQLAIDEQSAQPDASRADRRNPRRETQGHDIDCYLHGAQNGMPRLPQREIFPSPASENGG